MKKGLIGKIVAIAVALVLVVVLGVTMHGEGKMIDCDACEGSGVTASLNEETHQYETAPCEDCEGTG